MTTDAWHGTTSDSNTGLWGLNSLLFGSAGIQGLFSDPQSYFQTRFEEQAAAGNNLNAFIDYFAYKKIFTKEGAAFLAMAIFVPELELEEDLFLDSEEAEAGEGLWRSTDALRQHNGDFERVVEEVGLTDKQARMLHDEITGQGFSPDEIRAIARAIANK